MKLTQRIPQKILMTSAILALALSAIGATLAYFSGHTQRLTNEFTPGVADISVVEPSSSYSLNPDNTVNKVVQIKNVPHGTRSVPVYVRVKLIPIMRWSNGNGSGDPVTVDYTFPSNDWTKEPVDGYYYYKAALAPNATTDPLISKATVPGGIPAGKHLEIQVIADSIQAVGGAERDAWGMAYSNGEWQTAH